MHSGLLSRIFLTLSFVALCGCKIEVVVPPGGSVATESGSLFCAAGNNCAVEVSDLEFDEIFTATADSGYLFAGWKRREKGLFGGSTDSSVRWFTSIAEGNEFLESLLDADLVFYLEPIFFPVQNAAAAELDWPSYAQKIDQLASVYGSVPTRINLEQHWFESLQISPRHFTGREDTFTTAENPQQGVGYGSYISLGDDRQLVFYSNWSPTEPAAGAALALEYDGGVPVRLDIDRIEGATHSWVLDNGDGTKSVVFMGVDEGNISPDHNADAPTYAFNVETRQWVSTGIQTATHHSIPFDYDRDGDEDVVAQSWGPPFNTNYVLENLGGSYKAVQLATWGPSYINGMAIAPYHPDASNRLGIVVTDTFPLPELGIAPEYNALIQLAPDLRRIESAGQLPLPYFEREEFSGIQQVIPDWEGSVGLSHEVAARMMDIDQDGAIDIILSSLIWSDEKPVMVLQLLMQRNGRYVDETDSRLFNWNLMGGGAHRLDYADVNGDGFIDILASDNGIMWEVLDAAGVEDYSIAANARVLVNDGTGHFAVVAEQQIHGDYGYMPSYVFFLDEAGELNWSSMDTNGGNDVRVVTRSLNMKLSTGPNGIDPAQYGAPGFNEFYYLLHNEDVAAMVKAGEYSSGLHHYLAVGRAQERQVKASAP
ncbi:MAG: VCBS repeat-containing protein [Halieaceae bacterium]